MLNFDDILLELSYRVESGVVDLTNKQHIDLLKNIIVETNDSISINDDTIEKAVIMFEYLLEIDKKKSKAVKSQAEKLKLVGKGGNAWGPKGSDTVTHINRDGKLVKLDEPKKSGKKSKDTKQKKQPKKLAGSELESDAEVEKQEKEKKQKVEKTYKKIYGKNGKGPLLQKSKTTEDALKNGYVEGAEWVAPGNAGSNFNENFSNEGVLILERQSDLDEESLARIIYAKTKGSKLSKQQKDVSIGSQEGLSIPQDIPATDRELFKNCIITARSAKVKKDRADYSTQRAQEQVGFGKRTKNSVFGGTKNDLSRCEQELQKAKKIYVYDAETDQTVEVPKDVMIQWLNSGGGGENASDTVILTTDEKGNIIYEGWSDKKTLKDIQGNSSLNDDYTKSRNRLRQFREQGQIQISSENFGKAMDIINSDQKKIQQIESGYKNIIGIQANYFLNASNVEKLETEAYKDPATKKHMGKFKSEVDAVLKGKAKSDKKSNAIRNELLPPEKDESQEDYLIRFNKWAKGKKLKKGKYIKLLAKLATVNPDTLSESNRKIIARISGKEKQRHVDAGQKVPTALDTDEALSALRKKSLDLQKKTFMKLNEINVINRNGKKKKLGDVLGYEDAKDALHLDKINKPKNDEDYHQLLKRNTQLVLEGVSVTPKVLKECIGASNGKDLEDNFELLFEERYQRDEKTNRITGKVVYVYAYDKGGKKKRIAEKVYRPKQGQYAPTANTVQWSKEMQSCFDSKRKNK